MNGQTYDCWFTDYPVTHERAGMTVQVVTRAYLDGQVGRLGAERDALADAVRAWLHFDNTDEPPGPDAPYDAILAYEQRKAEITEAVAAALPRREQPS